MSKPSTQELYSSSAEHEVRATFVQQFRACPIPDEDLLQNLGLFISSKNMARILFMDHIYRLNVPVHGTVMEFGTRWGQNLALFAAFRGIYEPFNRMRKIVGFDTFEGFPNLDAVKDNLGCKFMHEGGLACTPGYDEYLRQIMQLQEADNPMSHVKKYDVIKGDASVTVEKYFQDFPETMVSLAFFDFDIFKPTLDCLRAIKGRVTKGSVIAFDELSDRDSPGETLALNEVWGLSNVRIQRLPFVNRVSYFIVE